MKIIKVECSICEDNIELDDTTLECETCNTFIDVSNFTANVAKLRVESWPKTPKRVKFENFIATFE